MFGDGRKSGSVHIIEILKMKVIGSEAIFILDFADQGDLGILYPEPLCPLLAQNYFRQMIFGLDYIHSRNVVHRDIKPRNLFLKSPNKLKIGDFGMAEFFRDKDGKQIWISGAHGTLGFAAPEVFIRGLESKGPPLDVWSAGVVLVDLLTKNQLWRGARMGDVNFAKYYNKDYDGMTFDWRSLGGATSLVRKMLNVQSAYRITIDEILSDPWFVVDIADETIGKCEE
ncbi:hypothetical protein B9Z55_026680 [Caenorhabditis nigoni]|uniref:Protein kinase domain-containing protein n=2 Tax=Caenorhabditis nigoni TaxID=1611254 RepID=A0A2G5T4F7_9PELO|nr:hypothetical protein B9Z55_026680 [Caenorhabditis nigoni]